MTSRNRGKPKPKISDISRTPPTEEELTALQDALATTPLHPITTAVLGAVLVEHELEVELRRRLKCSDDAWKELVSDIGPLRGFHTKIVMGRALRIYGDNMRDNFNIVRNIRNQFAHSKKLVDFKHPLIVKELKKAKPIPGERKHFHYVSANEAGPQDAYISLCMLLSVALMKPGTKASQAKTRRLKVKLSPWAKGLLDTLIPPIDAQGATPLSSLASLLVGPKYAAQQGWLLEALQRSAKKNNNEDT